MKSCLSRAKRAVKMARRSPSVGSLLASLRGSGLYSIMVDSGNKSTFPTASAERLEHFGSRSPSHAGQFGINDEVTDVCGPDAPVSSAKDAGCTVVMLLGRAQDVNVRKCQLCIVP